MTKTTESAAKNETKPTALTEEQRKAKRNEYARAYYAAHKEACKAAVKRCNEKKRALAGKKPASKGKAHHAICQDKPAAKKQAKKVLKPTAEQKHLAKLQKLLAKSEAKLAQIAGKAAAQKAEVKQIKAGVKEAKVLVKACKKANAAVKA